MGRFDGPKFTGLGLSFCLLLVRAMEEIPAIRVFAAGAFSPAPSPCVRRRRLPLSPEGLEAARRPHPRPPPPAFS